MRYRIEIAEEAMDEIKAARLWYEEQQAGLGSSFSKTIKQHINDLANENVEHKIVIGNVRRLLVKRFRYVIYYSRNEQARLIKVMLYFMTDKTSKG